MEPIFTVFVTAIDWRLVWLRCDTRRKQGRSVYGGIRLLYGHKLLKTGRFHLRPKNPPGRPESVASTESPGG